MPDRECTDFLQWALPRMGLRWEGYRRVRRQVCRRLQRRLRLLGIEDLESYASYLRYAPYEWDRTRELCRVTISRFFRDRGVFANLQRVILPELGAGVSGRPLRVWSAGCASGEEPYSLAMLFRFAPELAGSPSPEILGTDIDDTVLRRAATGCYPRSALREVPTAWAENAFRRHDDLWCLDSACRRHVALMHHDLSRAPPASAPFDMVMCRNLAFTYFDEREQRRTVANLAGVLRPGGVLVVGSHECLPGGQREFIPSPAARSVFVRRKAVVSMLTEEGAGRRSQSSGR